MDYLFSRNSRNGIFGMKRTYLIGLSFCVAFLLLAGVVHAREIEREVCGYKLNTTFVEYTRVIRGKTFTWRRPVVEREKICHTVTFETPERPERPERPPRPTFPPRPSPIQPVTP